MHVPFLKSCFDNLSLQIAVASQRTTPGAGYYRTWQISSGKRPFGTGVNSFSFEFLILAYLSSCWFAVLYGSCTEEVAFTRRLLREKAVRGALCYQNPETVMNIGVGMLHGARGVTGSAENDAAAGWYTTYPSDGTNKGKGRCPSGALTTKVTLRLVHGAGIYATIAPWWVQSSGNPDFVCTSIHQSFLELEKQHGRLPSKW